MDQKKEREVLLMCFGLYIDLLNVSMRFGVIFCIYEHIKKYMFRDVSEKFEMFGFLKTFFCYFKFKSRADMLSIE